jgi:hypothetical protein
VLGRPSIHSKRSPETGERRWDSEWKGMSHGIPIYMAIWDNMDISHKYQKIWDMNGISWAL